MVHDFTALLNCVPSTYVVPGDMFAQIDGAAEQLYNMHGSVREAVHAQSKYK